MSAHNKGKKGFCCAICARIAFTRRTTTAPTVFPIVSRFGTARAKVTLPAGKDFCSRCNPRTYTGVSGLRFDVLVGSY